MIARLVLFSALLVSQSLFGASATTTLQLTWPDDLLSMTEEQAMDKAVTFLRSDDFAHDAARMPKNQKAAFADSVKLNNSRNTDAIADQIRKSLTVTPDAERGVITLTFRNPLPHVAVDVANFCAHVAVRDSRFYVADHTSPEASQLKSQMEKVEDDIQQYRLQMRNMNNQQQAQNRMQIRNSNIGAPSNIHMPNTNNVQNRATRSVVDTRIKALNQQYNELRKQYNSAVQSAMKQEGKVGLVVIDHADLDAES